MLVITGHAMVVCTLYLKPNDNDIYLESQQDAELKAHEMSISNNGTPVAVWDDNDRTVKLFAGYEVFVPSK